jgi:cytochrome c oxidase subunit II
VIVEAPVLFADGTPPTQNLSIFDPVSPPAESIQQLAIFVLAITGVIFLIVEGILVYSLVRFRRTSTSSAEPPQVYGSKPIEVAWTAAPLLTVFVLVLVAARTLWEVNVPPPEPREGDNTLFVTAVGWQWWWEFTYDHYNGKPIRAIGPDGKETDLPVVTANELHIPASESGTARPVFLILRSGDVCHSFWVPRLGGKTDLIPGRTNSMWFRTDRPGLYVGQCAEYCGTQHANMLLRVVVTPPGEFDEWLRNQATPARTPPQDDSEESKRIRAGQKAFFGQSCTTCHTVRGPAINGVRAKGSYPDLTHLMSREKLAAGMIPNTPENLKRWIADPQSIKPGCLMAPFGGLPDREREDIVRYLGTLR